ncbi:hypothetical protein BdWA1_000470 [Babesia duncani]|uniref:Uncharacterized protein n=1 Tax=Babesia duncani TaxID=323732 RepID=A0AAD9UQ42_9APIC|nr:hypothetical protein BdWA1_000470 [Babesia duncani]
MQIDQCPQVVMQQCQLDQHLATRPFPPGPIDALFIQSENGHLLTSRKHAIAVAQQEDTCSAPTLRNYLHKITHRLYVPQSTSTFAQATTLIAKVSKQNSHLQCEAKVKASEEGDVMTFKLGALVATHNRASLVTTIEWDNGIQEPGTLQCAALNLLTQLKDTLKNHEKLSF